MENGDRWAWVDRFLDAGFSLRIPFGGGGELIIGEGRGIPYPVAIAALLIVVLVLARR